MDGCQSLYRYFVILVQQYNCIYLLLFIYEDRCNILIYLRILTEINATSNLPIATSTGIFLLLPFEFHSFPKFKHKYAGPHLQIGRFRNISLDIEP